MGEQSDILAAGRAEFVLSARRELVVAARAVALLMAADARCRAARSVRRGKRPNGDRFLGAYHRANAARDAGSGIELETGVALAGIRAQRRRRTDGRAHAMMGACVADFDLRDRARRQPAVPAGGDFFQQSDPLGGHRPSGIKGIGTGSRQQRPEKLPPPEIDFFDASFHLLAARHSAGLLYEDA